MMDAVGFAGRVLPLLNISSEMGCYSRKTVHGVLVTGVLCLHPTSGPAQLKPYYGFSL